MTNTHTDTSDSVVFIEHSVYCMFLFCSPEAREAQPGVCRRSTARRSQCLHRSTHTRSHRRRTHTPGHGWRQCTLSFNLAATELLSTTTIACVPPHPHLFQQPFGLMCIQLACYHGVKVLTTSHSEQQHAFLEKLRPSVGLYGLVFETCQTTSQHHPFK